ncbi:hypothetical protein [Thermococcus stetteri]|uniref:hypothetical protein n=1 Tax=Thermococcus stetteri TaxID=49900 RepID=UPI001FD8250E|nr:hypothetical protein [Thermococcus stetteri]MBP1912387.1 hypothetical protein [Thermococcus stetteri]
MLIIEPNIVPNQTRLAIMARMAAQRYLLFSSESLALQGGEEVNIRARMKGLTSS